MNRLKEARKAANLTQAEVARRIGINQNSYSYWETGKVKIDNQSLSKLAAIFGVTTDYLLGLDSNAMPKAVRIPVFGSIPAGIPTEAIDDVVDWEELPPDMFAGGKEYFALKVKGDSMYPDYLDGDTIIVLKSATCNTGDVCVIFVNGYDATLKQVKLSDDGSLTIVPRNPEYPPRTFSVEEINSLPVTIAGVVVELRRKIR